MPSGVPLVEGTPSSAANADRPTSARAHYLTTSANAAQRLRALGPTDKAGRPIRHSKLGTNQVVMYYEGMLDQTFAALSDPTRRSILERLATKDGLTVGVVAEAFPVSLPAVIKHLDVLVDAGLVTRTRTGRTVTCRLATDPMAEAMTWLKRHARFWEPRLDALGVVLEQERRIHDDQERLGRDRSQEPR